MRNLYDDNLTTSHLRITVPCGTNLNLLKLILLQDLAKHEVMIHIQKFPTQHDNFQTFYPSTKL